MAAEKDRVALVTGASSGIGEAAARALVGAGFTVYGTSRKATAGEKRGGVVFLPLDVTDDESVAGAVREVLDRSGRIDVLVNNAGLGVAGAAEESSVEQARALFETNFFGSIRMIRAVLPHMREQRSRRAAVGALVAVLGREVDADERLESRPICGLGVEAVALGAQLVGEDVRDKILLGGEVRVEGAVGQAGVGHNGRHAGAIDAVLLEAPPGRFEDALSGGLLLVLAVSHREPLSSNWSRSCRGPRHAGV